MARCPVCRCDCRVIWYGFEFLRGLEGTETSEASASFSAWLPKAGVRWTASDDVRVAFVVQRAYRAGGAELSFVSNELIEFDPEYLWNYELSFRTAWLDGALTWNTNFYYSDWTDQQVTLPLDPPFQFFFQTVNAGTSELYGLESEFNYVFNDELSLYGSVGYSIAEFVDFPNGNFDPTQPDAPTNQDNFSGNRFPFAPALSFNGGFNYQQEDGFFGGVDVSYQDGAFQEVENFAGNRMNARALVNARIGYTISEGVNISTYFRNLFDADYFTSLGRTIPGQNFARLGDEFTWALRLDVNF